MIISFNSFKLDREKAELRDQDDLVHMEPQVYDLLCFLLDNRNRLVTRDELVEHVWQGSDIYDSTISSRVKTLRHALGDNGISQEIIKTVRGRGYRFVAEVTSPTPALDVDTGELMPPVATGSQATKPSIVVLPFSLMTRSPDAQVFGDGLVHDLILNLSKLRWLFVIARLTSFQFRNTDRGLDDICAELKVRYCLSGHIELIQNGLAVSVELTDARTQAVIWAERFTGDMGKIHEIRAEIAAHVIDALELEIPPFEVERARNMGENGFDIWSSYHLGLSHIYQFRKADNALGKSLLRKVVETDPTFSRGHAALSFACFQGCRIGYDDAPDEYYNARKHAELSLELDPRDPFACLAMRRVNWMEGTLHEGLRHLDQANELNPNYAHGQLTDGRIAVMAEGAGSGIDAMEL